MKITISEEERKDFINYYIEFVNTYTVEFIREIQKIEENDGEVESFVPLIKSFAKVDTFIHLIMETNLTEMTQDDYDNYKLNSFTNEIVNDLRCHNALKREKVNYKPVIKQENKNKKKIKDILEEDN